MVLFKMHSPQIHVFKVIRAASTKHGYPFLFSRLLAVLLTCCALGATCQPTYAQLASKPAEEWIKLLESSHRVGALKVQEIINKLELQPGSVIADVGAGSGLFTIPLARAVGPKGVVYAVDIEQGLLDHIAARAAQQNVTNVQTVLGKFTDPNLPRSNVDLAFMCDVLHHIEKREAYLKSLVTYLKPSGRVAVVDFYPGRGPHPEEPALQVTKEQATEWMAALGFRPTAEHAIFDDKWFVVYSRQK